MLKESQRYQQELQQDEEEYEEDDAAVDLNVRSRIIEQMSFKRPYKDVGQVLYVDSKIMNFNTYYPGKLLGSNLMVANLSDCEQIIELSVDQINYTYNIDDLEIKYPQLAQEYDAKNSSIPFKLRQNKDQSRMVNSEIKHESWFIENPISKELTKRITLKLGPKAEQDFIIVVRSPNIRKCQNMLSLINIGLLTYQGEEFGVKESFEDFLRTNYENSMKAFLSDRKQLSVDQRIEILMAGKVDVPRLACLKEMSLGEYNQKIVPIAIKKIP